MVPLEGADNCISIIITSIYYLPNTLLVPLHFHSVIHAVNHLLLQMIHGIGIPIPFKRIRKAKCLGQFISRGWAPNYQFSFFLF